jgi:phosphohistidine phosphatase
MTAKTLLLMRHAKSDWSRGDASDFDRPLNKRGRHAASLMGEYLKAMNVVPGLALVSAAVRTRETWERIAAEFPAAQGAMETRDELYLAQPPAILAAVSSAPESVKTLLVLGHNPGIAQSVGLIANANSESSAMLASVREKFPTGAIAQLTLTDILWAEIRPATGQLVTFTTPKTLEKLGAEAAPR